MKMHAFGATALILVVALCESSEAQTRTKMKGIMGEDMTDTSNWPHPAAPDGNPYVRSTASPVERVQRSRQEQLGKLLFWEEQVSSDNSMACGTCHEMKAGGVDSRPTSPSPLPGANRGVRGMFAQSLVTPGGMGANPVEYGFKLTSTTDEQRRVTDRYTPTMVGAHVFDSLFWQKTAGPELFVEGTTQVVPGFDDWSAGEALSIVPPLSDVEMAHEDLKWSDGFIQAKLGESFPMALVDPTTIPPSVQVFVNSGLNYADIFDAVFQDHTNIDLNNVNGTQGVTRERFAAAVAHYMRTLIPDKAPIDEGTMDADMIAGFDIMHDSNCFNCHSATGNPILVGGKLQEAFDNPLSDGNIHNIFNINNPDTDVKTPTLRNVGLRTRFFSTGLVPGAGLMNNLDDVITFYDGQVGNLGFDGSGPGGTLTTTEFDQVKAFLGRGLLDTRVALEQPPFDRPQLASQRPGYEVFGDDVFGPGTAGASGLVPEIFANIPPLVGASTDWFKLGMGGTVANSPARLFISNTSSTVGPLFVGFPFLSVTAAMTNSDGFATIQNPVPLTIGTVGLDFFAQWQVLDGPTGANSSAARFTPLL